MPSTDEEFITLAEAVDRYRCEAGYCNAYSTLRAHAAEWGRVHLGEYMPAVKVRGRWVIRRSDLDSGIAAEARRRAAQAEAAADYDRHILHGADGNQISTTWGYYRRQGSFHFVHYSSVPPWKSDGTWICSTCWQVASTEHDKPECHSCSDWNGCGRDCTLSAVLCDPCGQRLAV